MSQDSDTSPNSSASAPKNMSPDTPEKLYLFDKPKNVQRLLRGFYFCCVLLVLAEFVIHRHLVHPWEGLFAFHALYGFVACVVLVLAATQLRKLLMRDENYYDTPADSSPTDSSPADSAPQPIGSDHVGH